MIDKNKVLEIVKEKGPVLPKDIVKEVGTDTFMVGAILSQLVDSRQVKISHTKVGGSPVYYVSGQEEKLQYLYEYLHEKEKKAYDLLKKEKILQDRKLEPLIRVALRNIRDFAKPLEVNIKGQREIFWKWYLLPNEEAEKIIKKKLLVVEKKPDFEKEEELKKQSEEKQQSLSQLTDEKDLLLTKIKKLFSEKRIKIIETKVVRKNSDLELLIKIPSPVGNLKFFCKVKDKKKTNDKDLSSLYVLSQMKKLPILYITTGELTKKAKEMLEKEFKIISVLQI